MTLPANAEILVTADQLHVRIQELALEIGDRPGDDLIVIAVLKGTLPFLADLVRALPGNPSVDFLAISSYAPESGRVRIIKDLDQDISGRRVLLVEDIVDTGLTVGFLINELERRDPRSVEVCTLLDRTSRRILPVPVDHVGFEVSDAFVIGFGLDFKGRYRNLDLIAIADREALENDPDAYVHQFYGPSSGVAGGQTR